jgi:putative acetyltransferase
MCCGIVSRRRVLDIIRRVSRGSSRSISVEDPSGIDVRELLVAHLAFTEFHSPPEDMHALDLEGLLDPSVTFLSYRTDGELVAVGALKRLDSTHAELKSMHVAEAARRRGIGREMLDHLLAMARERGFHRVSIETGAQPAFVAARALYASAGFMRCDPFGQYVTSLHSTFMTLELAPVEDGQAAS